MAYTTTELNDYWTNVQDTVVDTTDLAEQSTVNRDEAMSFTEEYTYDPAQAELMSDRLSGVLESDSPYIQRARTKATEDAGSRGLMNSSMAAGAAEGAAIDRGLQVAQGDVDVDKFNVGEQNRFGESRYNTAGTLASATQQSQDALGGAEADYRFNLGIEDKKHVQAGEAAYNDFLYNIEKQNQLAEDQMDQDVLTAAADRALEMLKQDSILSTKYMDAFSAIASSDISAADKTSQIEALTDQYNTMILELTSYADIELVGDGVPDMGFTTDWVAGDYTLDSTYTTVLERDENVTEILTDNPNLTAEELAAAAAISLAEAEAAIAADEAAAQAEEDAAANSTATFTTNIEDAYTSVLGRDADADGLSYWLNDSNLTSDSTIAEIEEALYNAALQNVATVDGIASTLAVTGQEYISITNPTNDDSSYYFKDGSFSTVEPLSTVIFDDAMMNALASAFVTVTDRDAAARPEDQGGVSYWQDQVDANPQWTPDEAEMIIYNGAIAYHESGAAIVDANGYGFDTTTHPETGEVIYWQPYSTTPVDTSSGSTIATDLLGRDVTSSAWDTYLSSNGEAATLTAIMSSSEYKANVIYRELLDRDMTDAGRASSIAYYDANGEAALRDFIMSSAEYQG